MVQPDILKVKILAYDAQREMVHFGVNGWRGGKPVSISGAVALSLPADPPASEVNAAAQEAVVTCLSTRRDCSPFNTSSLKRADHHPRRMNIFDQDIVLDAGFQSRPGTNSDPAH